MKLNVHHFKAERDAVTRDAQEVGTYTEQTSSYVRIISQASGNIPAVAEIEGPAIRNLTATVSSKTSIIRFYAFMHNGEHISGRSRLQRIAGVSNE